MSITVAALAEELDVNRELFARYVPLHSLHPDALVSDELADRIREGVASERDERVAESKTSPAEFSFEAYEPGPCVLAAIDCAAFQITTAGLKSARAGEVLAPLMTTMVAAVAMAELVANGVAPYAGPDGELAEPDRAAADKLSEWANERVSSAALVTLLDMMKRQNHPTIVTIISRLSK